MTCIDLNIFLLSTSGEKKQVEEQGGCNMRLHLVKIREKQLWARGMLQSFLNDLYPKVLKESYKFHFALEELETSCPAKKKASHTTVENTVMKISPSLLCLLVSLSLCLCLSLRSGFCWIPRLNLLLDSSFHIAEPNKIVTHLGFRSTAQRPNGFFCHETYKLVLKSFGDSQSSWMAPQFQQTLQSSTFKSVLNSRF